jgi:hypothetical protein
VTDQRNALEARIWKEFPADKAAEAACLALAMLFSSGFTSGGGTAARHGTRNQSGLGQGRPCPDHVADNASQLTSGMRRRIGKFAEQSGVDQGDHDMSRGHGGDPAFLTADDPDHPLAVDPANLRQVSLFGQAVPDGEDGLLLLRG